MKQHCYYGNGLLTAFGHFLVMRAGRGKSSKSMHQMGYSRGIFLPKHLEGHLLSAGTLFVMKLNPESTVGQFVCAPRQEDREKALSSQEFCRGEPHFSTYSHHKQSLIQSPRACPSFPSYRLTTKGTGNRWKSWRQLQWHRVTVSGTGGRTCPQPSHCDIHCCTPQTSPCPQALQR